MIAPADKNQQLSQSALDEIRDLWGSGVALGILALRYGVTERSLREQLERHRRSERIVVVSTLRRMIDDRRRDSGAES